MAASPAVSIILPTFNRLDLLRVAVESVLAQTFADWELLVADDGSGAETRAYLLALTDPRVRVLWLPHTGNPAAVRNAAIRGARGRYLAFLDSDDSWLPAKLERQLAALGARGDCRWSYTPTERLDALGRPVPDATPFVPHNGTIALALLRIDAYLATPTVVAERALVVEAGGFDEAQRFGEDYDLWLRLALRSPVVVVNERLARVRLHRDNYSHDRPGFYRGWLRFYAKAAATLDDPEARAICTRKRAELSIGLANLEADRRAPREVLRALSDAWLDGRGDRRWWGGATKAALRSVVPARLLALGRKLQRRA
jgi:glycosyltransferase involved in cell wall biosynthesis